MDISDAKDKGFKEIIKQATKVGAMSMIEEYTDFLMAFGSMKMAQCIHSASIDGKKSTILFKIRELDTDDGRTPFTFMVDVVDATYGDEDIIIAVPLSVDTEEEAMKTAKHLSKEMNKGIAEILEVSTESAVEIIEDKSINVVNDSTRSKSKKIEKGIGHYPHIDGGYKN